jgi:hypothetical protein
MTACEANQFIAMRMAGIFILKKSNIRVPQTHFVDFGDAFTQALRSW